MLSSIHPFGERSRNQNFSITAAAHVIGSAAGGLALGVVAGGIGVALNEVTTMSAEFRTGVVSVVALVGLAFEATGRERLLPTRSRQVDENWIQSYRGWVYGGGFGAELGFGISTIITTALVHVMVVAMVLQGSFVNAVLLGTLFGFVRGATILTAARVDDPEALRHFHRRLDALRARSHRFGVAALFITTLLGTGALFT